MKVSVENREKSCKNLIWSPSFQDFFWKKRGGDEAGAGLCWVWKKITTQRADWHSMKFWSAADLTSGERNLAEYEKKSLNKGRGTYHGILTYSGKRCGCVATRPAAVPLHPPWNFGIPGNMGILGRDVISLHWALWNSRIPGIMGRDVMLPPPPPSRENRQI